MLAAMQHGHSGSLSAGEPGVSEVSCQSDAAETSELQQHRHPNVYASKSLIDSKAETNAVLN